MNDIPNTPSWVERTGGEPENHPEGQEKNKVALFLQGGGALGAYQASVYATLSKLGIQPDWVAGISIGAINGAIIAGNPPEKRAKKLKDFWDYIATDHSPATATQMMINGWKKTLDLFRSVNPFLLPEIDTPADLLITSMNIQNQNNKHNANFNAFATIMEGVNHFFGRYGSGGKTAIYDTSLMKDTLKEFVDFKYLNSDEAPRYSAGAVNVETREVVYFDNKGASEVSEIKRGVLRTPQITEKCEITPEHIMASAALGPQFPTINIPLLNSDGTKNKDRYFWDAGLVTNTPARWAYVTGQLDNKTSVIRADLHEAKGTVPTNLVEARERAIDLKFSSPPLGIGAEEIAGMIRVVCKKREQQSDSKGFDFSPAAIKANMEEGREDILNALENCLGDKGIVRKHYIERTPLSPEELYKVLHDTSQCEQDMGQSNSPGTRAK